MSKLTAEMIFFLMAICHQPYSEIMKIPIEDAKEMMTVFTKTLESIFGKGKKGKENLIRVAQNFDPKAFEAMWKPKEGEDTK